MTEDEFKALKRGDRVERKAADGKHFRATVTKTIDSGGNVAMSITEVIEDHRNDLSVGKIYIGGVGYCERYALLDQAAIPFPKSPATSAQEHIAGLSPETVDWKKVMHGKWE